MPPNATTATQSLSDMCPPGPQSTTTKSVSDPAATTGVLFECDSETIDGGLVKDITTLKKAEKRKLKLVWRNIIAFAYLHAAALYGAWLMITSASWSTVAFGEFFSCLFLEEVVISQNN